GSGGYAFIGGQAAYAEHPVPRNSFLEGDTPSWTWQDILSKRAEVWGHKQRLNEIYRTSLPAGIQLPEHFQQWRFHIRMENPAPVVAALFAAPGRLFAAPGRLFAGRHYASRALPGTCPCAEDLAAHVINLFNDLYYSEEQAYRTCEIIRRFLA
ncbi:MAG: hypothetical protein J5871_05315, partial [Bacteroidales bacterium]|nr:hypothetical protein [Bacteroidales bacterium]